MLSARGALVARLETSEKHVLQVVRNWWMVRMQLPNLHLNSSEARVYDDVIFYCRGRTLLFEGNQGVLKKTVLCCQFEIEKLSCKVSTECFNCH